MGFKTLRTTLIRLDDNIENETPFKILSACDL